MNVESESLVALLDAAARRAPDRIALIADRRTDPVRPLTLTWSELADQVRRAAAAFARLGLRPGDRIGVQLGNTVEFPIAFFGALRAGLTVVPVNPGYTEPELVTVLRDAGAAALLTESVAALEAAGVLGVPTLIVAGQVAGAQVPDGAHGLAELMAADAEAVHEHCDLAALVYTSGTTGRPRGAMLTHRALVANLDQCAALEPAVLKPSDVVLLALPFFHVYGLGPGLGMLTRTAATGVLMERFDAESALRLMTEQRVSVVLGAPPMYADLVETDADALATAFGSVRLAMSGAAPLSGEVADRLRRLTGTRLQQGYGLTETAPVLTCTVGRPAKSGSIGAPVPGVDLWLRDLEEPGAPVEEGDPGEIVVRGPNLFSGYWPDGADGPGESGWFGTGDVAYADAEGDLFLVDRAKELIIVSGFNVYPAEVEAVLLNHPSVAEAAAVGVPDERDGEAVKAFVVAASGRISTAELASWCAHSLARFKCPREFEVVDALPHSATGKVRKVQLRKRS